MRYVIQTLLLAVWLAHAIGAQSYQDADRLFTNGEDLSKDMQSLGMATQAVQANPNDYQWLWRAARGHYFVGDGSKGAERLRNYQAGVSYGQRATAVQPNAVEGHFWLGANHGGVGEEKGGIRALSIIKKVRAEMEAVLRLNANYAEGSAYLALGELDRQVPGLLGGDLKRAIMRLETGVRVAPQNLEMKYVLAQAYQEAGRKEDARRLLNEVINGNARKRAEHNVQTKARVLLAKL